MINRFLIIVLGMLGALLCGCNPAHEKIVEIPAADLLLATEVMARAATTYEACTTYRDSGVMTRTFRAEEGTQEESQTFTTAFERPYRFRFECREAENRYIIYADAATVRAWWGIQDGIQPMASIDDAIARAVGPSNGASHTIPRLLMPEQVRGRSLAELSNLERLPDALLEDIPCYRITGADRNGAPYTVWIDRVTYLVRRIDEEHEFPDFSTTDSTVYYPELNPELTDTEFHLKAPVSETARKELTARSSQMSQ